MVPRLPNSAGSASLATKGPLPLRRALFDSFPRKLSPIPAPTPPPAAASAAGGGEMPVYSIRGVDVDFPFDAYDCQITYMDRVIESLQQVTNPPAAKSSKSAC